MEPCQIKKIHFTSQFQLSLRTTFQAKCIKQKNCFFIKEKAMMLQESYINTKKRTITTKFILRSQNRDCKAKTFLNINQLIEIKIIY